MATNVKDFYKNNPTYIGRANTSNRAKPNQSKKGSGNQSFLSSIISEVSGAGGAAGGAAAGAALGSVVPGIGTLVGGIGGGIVGGFLGGTGGRLAENQIRDREMRLGDALKEGAVSGAFGAVGPAWQSVRGLGALGKASGNLGLKGGVKALSGMSDDAATATAKAILGKGAKAGKAVGQGLTAGSDEFARATQKGMQRTGSRLRAYNRSTTIPGYKGLKPEEARQVNATLDNVNKWFSGVGKSQQFTNLDDAIKAVGNQYAKSPEGKQVFKYSDELINNFKNELSKNPSISQNLDDTVKGANKKLVQNLVADSKNFKTNDDFLKYMTEQVNKRYRDLSSATGSMGSKETQIYEAMRKAMKNVVDSKLSVKSGINKQITSLLQADDLLQEAITRDIGAGVGQGTTLGRILDSTIRPAADIAGRGMQQAGKVTQFTTPIAEGALARGMVGASETSRPQEQQEDYQPMWSDEMAGQQYSASAQNMMMPGQGAVQNYTIRDALAEADQILGGGGTVAQKLALAKEIKKEYDALGIGGDMTAVQKNKVAGYQTANAVVDQLESLWTGVSQPESQLLAGFAGAPGVKQIRSTFDAPTRQYSQFAEGTVAPIIKSLGETGVLTDRDIQRALGLIPNLQDSPKVAQNKIMGLRVLLENAQLATQNTGGGNTGLDSALLEYGIGE